MHSDHKAATKLLLHHELLLNSATHTLFQQIGNVKFVQARNIFPGFGSKESERSITCKTFCNRPVHAIRGIMGNQGKLTEKQSRKTNVFLYIPVLISHLVTKHIQQAEKPLF